MVYNSCMTVNYCLYRYWLVTCKTITRSFCYDSKSVAFREVFLTKPIPLCKQGIKPRIKMNNQGMRKYEDAIAALNGLQSNASIQAQTRKEKKVAEDGSIKQMESFMTRINLEVMDLQQLNIIHISGTKGKGSVAAFCESVMRHCGLRTGFYSSPHLVEVRERIRINGRPIEHEKFTKFFFECYDALMSTSSEYNGEMPAYFRFLTLLAYHVFLRENLDVVIIEVGIGGTYDCTNVLQHPTVCGITKLELDHTKMLGNTIEQIAWHKSGIMKSGVPVVTLPQSAGAEDVLAQRAKELNAHLKVAPPLSSYDSDIKFDVKYQEINASLALQLCRLWFYQQQNNIPDKNMYLSTHELTSLINTSPSLQEDSKYLNPFQLPQLFLEGIKKTRWPGRCQLINRDNMTFYIDGAHTLGSIQACVDWVISQQKKDLRVPRDDIFRVLVFYVTGDRDECSFLKILSDIGFDHAVFCPAVLDSDPSRKDSDLSNFNSTMDTKLKTCEKNYNYWTNFHSDVHVQVGNSNTHVKLSHEHANSATCFTSVSSAIRWIACGKDKDIGQPDVNAPSIPLRLLNAKHVQVVVTGSLHLVGTVMKYLGPDICEI